VRGILGSRNVAAGGKESADRLGIGGVRRFLGRRRTLVALIAASAVAASLLIRSDSIALAQDSGSTPTLDLTGVTVVVSGSLDLSSQSVLQQYVSEGTSNDTSITGGQLVIVNPVLGDSNFVIGGTGNDPRRVGQTYGVPSSGSGSETVWAFLENEARQILAAQHQIPNGGDIPYWGRGLMRAWMLIRLMEIIRKPTSERTTDEQAAVTFLRNKVWERQKQVIGRSVDQYYAWERDPCSFDPPAPYQYDTPAAYCNPNSYQSFILGTPPPPSAADFLDYGAASASEKALERIVRQLSEAQGIALQDAHPVVDVEFRRATNELRAGLDLFRVLGRGLVDGNTDFTGSGESPLSDDTLSTIKELYDEILVSEAADTVRVRDPRRLRPPRAR
jgi:hypothetical protein